MVKHTRYSDRTIRNVKDDLIADELTQAAIAKKRRVSRSLVSDIATGRVHRDKAWPYRSGPIKRSGGQYKKVDQADPTNRRILELEGEVLHLTEERNRERQRARASVKTQGLIRAIVEEMEQRIKPFSRLPSARRALRRRGRIEEHVVMHVSDGHHDQVITSDETGGLEQYDFNISCARAERYVDKVIDWCHGTLEGSFRFTTLWVPAYGDHTSGEIHNHGPRSYYRNQFKNCLAIGQLHALMYRDLAAHFDRVNVIYISGNHGRRTAQKDYAGAQDNFDYLIGEVARLHCRDLANVSFLLPNSWSINLDINGVGFHFCHGDDVPGNSGVPFYGMTRKQKGLIALNSLSGRHVRYFCMGHHHTLSSLSDIDGELIANGAWPATDAYSLNRFSGYREPMQLLHGVNPRYGITWRMHVKLKHPAELTGPRRYKIDGGRDVGPLLVS